MAEKDIAANRQARLQYFYDLPHDQQGFEWIKGEIVVKSPVRLEHSRCSINLFELVNAWSQLHRLGMVGIEKMLINLGPDYKFEPDLCFFGSLKADLFTARQAIFPVPDWVCEILSKKTRKYDLGIKFAAYQDAGVKEYWIIDPRKEKIKQYILKNQHYVLQPPVNGIITSTVITGFQIPQQIIFDNNLSFELMTEWVAAAEEAKAKAEKERADTEEAKAKAEKERADMEEAKAKAEKARADMEEAKAKAEKERADMEEAKAKAEKAAKEELIRLLNNALEKLVATGMTETDARELLGI